MSKKNGAPPISPIEKQPTPEELTQTVTNRVMGLVIMLAWGFVAGFALACLLPRIPPDE